MDAPLNLANVPLSVLMFFVAGAFLDNNIGSSFL